MTGESPLEQLTGPGGAFEIVIEEVLGVPLQVYGKRLASMRDLIAAADARDGVDWVVVHPLPGLSVTPNSTSPRGNSSLAMADF